MTILSLDETAELAELVDDDPTAVDAEQAAALAATTAADDYDLRDTAAETFRTLVATLDEERVAELFDMETLRPAMFADDVDAATGAELAVAALFETDPEDVLDARHDLAAAVGEYFGENEALEILTELAHRHEEVIDDAAALFDHDADSVRNLGVRIVKNVADETYYTEATEEPRPDDVGHLVSDLWTVAANGRERHGVRENATDALSIYAEARPEAVVDRVEDVAGLLDEVDSSIRQNLLELLLTVAREEPAAVEPVADRIEAELDDHTAHKWTKRRAVEILAALVEDSPGVVSSLDPIAAAVTESDTRDADAALTILAQLGDSSHLETILGRQSGDVAAAAPIVRRARESGDDPFDELLAFVDHDRPAARYDALVVLREEYPDRADELAPVFLDALDDDAEPDAYGYHQPARQAAAVGLATIASEQPELLADSALELFEQLQSLLGVDDRTTVSSLVNALAALALEDETVYERLVDGIDSSDDRERGASLRTLAAVAPYYPESLDDPIPTIADHLRAADGEPFADPAGSLVPSLSLIVEGLAEARPAAVEPAIDPLGDVYEDGKLWAFSGALASIAAHHPDEIAHLTDRLAEQYDEGSSGEYPADDSDAAVALAQLALADAADVRAAVEPLFDRSPEERPASFPLIALALGADDAVPDDWAVEDGELAGLLVETDDGWMQARTCRLLGELGYEPATPLVEAVEADPVSEWAGDAAAAARRQLN